MKQKQENQNIYSPLNPAALFMIQRRHRDIRRILASYAGAMKDVKLLEIGCGHGQWLAEFQMFGLHVANLAGIELDEERAKFAGKRIVGADVRAGNAVTLPWDDNSFDIVFQSTVFTSILDDEIKQKVADEMKRVCKPDGFILWYDFAYNNPKNPDVKGVKKCEIRKLFKDWNCEIRKVTLAPPIARRTVPFCWLFAEKLETFFPCLRTHLIAKISSV
jgi:ubiquinone/menaquinone biosynthesis C-methylase UbiE